MQFSFGKESKKMKNKSAIYINERAVTWFVIIVIFFKVVKLSDLSKSYS